MGFSRILAAVLFSLLLGWGGAAVSGAVAASMTHHAANSGENAEVGCGEQPGHHGHEDHRHQDGYQDVDGHGHGDNSKLFHQGCCAMACGMSALEPVELQVKPIEWTPVRTLTIADDTLRDRPVSPLRRPPRPAA
ncbi:hypothetical protein JL100_003695 [Skermanella mucosa]|uniref:hypothetical protein n=1 Tax=Skermanella mucosa TaxID=1789672 RepID=UPI00192BB1BF|nr:hypothetical protein [Skermanella mucosa]UEM21881.1 hypothetical protein JL100_003695 [Skermanella mucosa]